MRDFLEGACTIDVKKRLSVEELEKHPVFDIYSQLNFYSGSKIKEFDGFKASNDDLLYYVQQLSARNKKTVEIKQVPEKNTSHLNVLKTKTPDINYTFSLKGNETIKKQSQFLKFILKVFYYTVKSNKDVMHLKLMYGIGKYILILKT